MPGARARGEAAARDAGGGAEEDPPGLWEAEKGSWRGQTKEETKKAELNFIDAYGDACINKNRPILIDMAEYQKIYQKNYRESHKPQIILTEIFV